MISSSVLLSRAIGVTSLVKTKIQLVHTLRYLVRTCLYVRKVRRSASGVISSRIYGKKCFSCDQVCLSRDDSKNVILAVVELFVIQRTNLCESNCNYMQVIVGSSLFVSRRSKPSKQSASDLSRTQKSCSYDFRARSTCTRTKTFYLNG